jgi:ABC-type transport system substrate-binding protein
MHLVLNSIDMNGYHAIAHSLVEEFAKIGITLILDYRSTEVLADTIGSAGAYWNITWDDAPDLGWDIKFWNNWCMPNNLLWWPGMFTADGMPPNGWQTHSFNNSKCDALLWGQFQEFDPVKRREMMLLFQEEWVHDVPAPVMYSTERVQVVDARFQTPWGTPGWEDAVWWYDPYIYTWVEDPMPETVVVKWADDGIWRTYNPFFMWTTPQDVTSCLTHSMLYVISKEYGAAIGEDYLTKPYLATDYPVWSDDYLTCNISLVQDVYWHNFTDIYTDPLNPVEYNNEQFTADDVVLTMTALMTPEAGSWGDGDYVNVLDTSVHPGGCEKLDDFTVRFHLQTPYVEFPDLMTNEWAVFIVPEHIMGSVPFGDWYNHWTNKVRPPPGTGPFSFVEDNVAEAYWKIVSVPNYSPTLGGQHTIDEIIGYTITNPAAGWTALMNQEIHHGFGAWDATPEQIAIADADPRWNVFNSPIPESRHLSLNLNHPILSNRYVRQAIAHAINYPHIRDNILPLVGIYLKLQAAPVYPSIEWAYHDTMPPYPYDIGLAQQYMDMWNYSLSANAPAGSPEVALGPVGDSDFSGLVELDDFVIWAESIGTAPSEWRWWSGQDIDPDADNTDYVELLDFYDWRENIGEYYPFYGAR